MHIYLMRHGSAENYAVTDKQRALTENGIRDNHSVAKKLSRQPLLPDCFLVSPYARALQTADNIAASFTEWEFVENDVFVPEANLHRALSELGKFQNMNPLLISHNPLLSDLLSLLVSGDARNSKRPYLGTSNLACIELDVLAAGCGELKYLLEPWK